MGDYKEAMNIGGIFRQQHPQVPVLDDSTKRSFKGPVHGAGSPAAKRTKVSTVMSSVRPWPGEWGQLSKADLDSRTLPGKDGTPGLRAMCSQLGLAKSGLKGELVTRLLEFQAKAKAAAPPPVSLPEAGDGAAQREADAPAPEAPPHQEPDLESEMTGHQGLAQQGSLPDFDSMI